MRPCRMSLTTQRGSRSTQKQTPPRYWQRCSTASRSRRGPDGPSISQLAPHRTAAEPFVLKRREPPQVGEALDLLAGIPAQLGGKLQPERAAGFRIEMPLDNIPDV